VGLVAIGLACVGDDDRPVLPVGCSARGGFDRDVGRDTDEYEGIDACHAENGVERGAVEPVCRLSPDDRLIGPGGDVVDDLNRGSTLQKSGAPDERAKQRGVRPDPGQPRLIGDQGVDYLRLGLAEPVQQPCLDADDSCLLGPLPEKPVEGGVDMAGHPFGHMHH
jgi:hypothetical protein